MSDQPASLLAYDVQVSGLRAAELVLVMGDAHVYADHVEPLQQQLKQQPFPFPVCFSMQHLDADTIMHRPSWTGAWLEHLGHHA